MPGATGSGGARAGSGRPRGSVARNTVLSRRLAAGIVESGESPLDLLMQDMRWWASQRDRLFAKIAAAAVPKGFCVETDSVLEIQDDMMKLYMRARKETREAALHAAPFVHPRLAPTKPEEGATVGINELASLTDPELEQLLAIGRKIESTYSSKAQGGKP
jgi:hypothetical protein